MKEYKKKTCFIFLEFCKAAHLVQNFKYSFENLTVKFLVVKMEFLGQNLIRKCSLSILLISNTEHTLYSYVRSYLFLHCRKEKKKKRKLSHPNNERD